MSVGDARGTFVLEPSIDRELPNPSDTVAAQATPHGQGRLPYLPALHNRGEEGGKWIVKDGMRPQREGWD